MQLVTLATVDFIKDLTLKKISHAASCNIGKYFPCCSYFAIISLA